MSAAASAAHALLGFGQVRHARLRPARNVFSYPTYFLLLPMRSLRLHGPGELALNRFAAVSFYDTDHGDGRSAEAGGALGWLEEQLLAHGVHGVDGEIWLHCMPRVFGHTFKPVSFWYCHGADGALRAVLVEVNNTFGERHCYVLDPAQYGVEACADKVFHVSPFCSVRGRYRFRFLRDARGKRLVARIDYEDADGALLQTSVSGTLERVAARSLRRAVWRYPAMTLGVVLRIHWQALRLWLKRVPFFSKPAPPAQFTTR